MSEEFFDEIPQENQPPKIVPTPKRKKKGIAAIAIIAIVALALCFSLIGGILGSGGTLVTMRIWEKIFPNITENTSEDTSVMQEGERENTVIDTQKIDTTKLMTPAEVYAANVNATVGITTAVTTNYWGFQTTSAASGSGFVLTDDGYILTNYHVIEDSTSITVSTYDGTAYDAELIGYDASNDIAVLKVEAVNLTPVIIGDSDNMNVGDTVLAIGNPLGELTFSMTQGIVSAMDRQVTFSTGTTMNLIQTDCSINSGNSGGALFNLYGEVVGITNAKYSNNGSAEASIESIGFAIPINDVIGIVESIIEKGYISKPYIGVSVTNVSQEMQSYGLPEGAAVKTITEDSPCEKAGLQVNDIITAVNDQKITGSNDLVAVVSDAQVGDILELTVYRMGNTLTLRVEVAEQIQQAIQEQVQTAPQTQQPVFPWGNYR